MTADNHRYANHKPKATLVNYSTVRAPELKLIYTHLQASPTSQVNQSTLQEKFTLDSDDHLAECLRFLHALDFIERPEDRVIELINQDVFPELSFEAKLLHHIKQQERPQDHLARAQDVAFEQARQSLDREQLVTDLAREVDYIEWNDTKVNMWYRLYQGLGVLSYVDSRELILSPSRALLYELFAEFKRQTGSNDFGDAVVWIEENFMSILARRPGTPLLHRGVTDTLQNLLDADIMSVRGMADAQNEIKLPATHSRNEEPAVKEFTLHKDLSDMSAGYQYPLDQFREVAE